MNYESAHQRVSQELSYLNRINKICLPKGLWQLGMTFVSFILIAVERTPAFTARLLNSCASLSRTINHQRTEWDQCVQNFLLKSNCYISPHVSQMRGPGMFSAWSKCEADFFSERLACGEAEQAGNSWWWRIRFGPCGRTQPTGPRCIRGCAAAHTSGLTHREKNPRC